MWWLMQESVSAQHLASRQAESARHELGHKDVHLDKLSARLSEEQAKTTQLRQELANITQQQVKVCQSSISVLC